MSHSEWVLDFSASRHISIDFSSFASMSPSLSFHVMTANGSHMPLAGVDSIITHHLSFSNIYLILKLTLNLFYVDQLCNFSDYLVIFLFFLLCTRSVVLEVDQDSS